MQWARFSAAVTAVAAYGGDAYILVFIEWQVDGEGEGGRWDDTGVGEGAGGGGGGGGAARGVGCEGRGVRAVM